MNPKPAKFTYSPFSIQAMNRLIPSLSLLSILLTSLPSYGAPVVLEDFEKLAGWQVTTKTTLFKKADSAAVGEGAIHLSLPGMVFKQLSSRPLEGSPAWDQYQGLSFMVKGDGSDLFGCISVGDRASGAYSYIYYFPLKNTDWHKVSVSWSDFIPNGQYNAINTPGALPPSGIKALRFGSRWSIHFNNDKIPAHSYSIDQVQIEEQVEQSNAKQSARPFADVMQLLKNRQPVHIVCIGDSITAGSGLPNKASQRYAVLTQNILREWLGYDDIIVESRAVGGAKSTDGRAWLARDFVGDAPDLITVMYGYNDKSNIYTKAYFKQSMDDYIQGAINQTQGKSAILPFATTPGTGPRFVMMDDYADTIREISAARKLPVFDLNRIMKKIGRAKIENYFVDQAHPNVKGHQFIADELASFLVKSAGITTPRPKAKAKPKAKPGKAYSWSFDNGITGWTLSRNEVSLANHKSGSSILFEMKTVGKDHRRAYSPTIPVSEEQSYRIESKVLCKSQTKGGIALYISAYPNISATGKGMIHHIKASSNSVGRSETLSGTFTIPPGMASIKVMIWSSVDSVGSYFIDDVKVTPLTD